MKKSALTIMLFKSDANTIYVSKTGNDTTGTGSISAPYLTINKAITVLNAGTKTIIDISAGTYTENLASGKDGFTIRAKSGQSVIIDGDGSDCLDITHDSIIIQNIKFTNAPHGIHCVGATTLLIDTVEVYDTTLEGILFSGTTSSEIRNTTVHGTTGGNGGFSLVLSSNNNTFRNCVAYENCRRGFHSTNTHSGLKYYDCISYNNKNSSNEANQGYGFEEEVDGLNNYYDSCIAYGQVHGMISKNCTGAQFVDCEAYNNNSGYGFYWKAGHTSTALRCNSHDNVGGNFGLESDTVSGTVCSAITINTCQISDSTNAGIVVADGNQTDFVSDNNTFSGNALIGTWLGVDKATLEEWQTASGQDANSTVIT